ncbi:hypothetical protein AM493_13900 [Flavobacterium akiainvivens]|uniref:Uncharacterized protein n=1 Tax=Flavobacterium akiainvivens TaxID=1202724 RepID=A0A0M8MAG4_9FLAO|nr:hypothetical protein [Flavobacterium akiainvivens]KOS07003.1 hypothetical protein AM493_13900 [Flavobacterium akiainvivens]SFQ59318.1 hypothetical protein SAMN05444144_10997 [Flavobacterium akiainvivens]
MKKFTLLFLFFSLAATAQVFPELDPTFLKPGMKVKPNEKMTYGFENFYEKKYKRYKTTGRETAANELIGRVFEIVEVAPYDEANPIEYYFITLKDTATGEVLYYKNWVKNTNSNELLMIDDIALPSDYFCKYITSTPGYNTYFVVESIIRMTKSFTDGKPRYSLTIRSGVFKKNSGKGTITITLKDGKTIVRKNVSTKATPTVGGEVESYEANITLTEAELKLLKESEIVTCNFFSLHDEPINQQTAGTIKGTIDCLMEKK